MVKQKPPGRRPQQDEADHTKDELEEYLGDFYRNVDR